MSLPFQIDPHEEVSRSWRKPFLVHLFAFLQSSYVNVKGLANLGYMGLLQVGETLVSYLSPGIASSRKAPVLPSKPCRFTLWLLGKAYVVMCQADGAHFLSWRC